LRAEAQSKAALFELMGEALTAVVTAPQSVRPEVEISIRCEAPDDAVLLVDWLNALIYEMVTRSLLFSAWHVEIDDHRLSATVLGQAVDRTVHEPAVEVKGATYTALECSHQPDGRWTAQCVVDV
jgi:tRNA nucleotidyltransferase (CCA-adding enzyme)